MRSAFLRTALFAAALVGLLVSPVFAQGGSAKPTLTFDPGGRLMQIVFRVNF